MPKRKAKEMGDGASLDEPRRSSRRVSTEKETSKPLATPKRSKKVENVEKEQPAEVDGKVEENEKYVSLNTSFCIVLDLPIAASLTKSISTSSTKNGYVSPSSTFLLACFLDLV
jgi:hypothetical protein